MALLWLSQPWKAIYTIFTWVRVPLHAIALFFLCLAKPLHPECRHRYYRTALHRGVIWRMAFNKNAEIHTPKIREYTP